MFLSPDKHPHSQGGGPRPRWARAGLQRRSRPSPAEAGGPALAPQADVNPGGVFFSSAYLKKKQNPPHSPHEKYRSCCRQTIILQSHHDPCAEKKNRKSLHPTQSKPGRVNLWKSPGRRGSNPLAEEQQEVGRQAGERTGKEEAESLKVKTNVNLTPAL